MLSADVHYVLVAVALTLLVSQFLTSGVSKLVQTRTCNDAKILDQFFGKRCWATLPTLLLAGLWEVVASCIVLYVTLYARGHKRARSYALLSLALFTVLATLMFKLEWPKRWYGFISNVSVTGGLLLAALVDVDPRH